MKVGLIARADDRGLGTMTWEFARHLGPDRILVIDMGRRHNAQFPVHLERYPGATVAEWSPTNELDEALVRGWLGGLDVIYSAETFYDPRVVDWAADAGVATVLHAMPEFYRADLPRPSAVWLPTTWRQAAMPDDAVVVPVPVAAPCGPGVGLNATTDADRLRVLHVAGHRAAMDRNGTTVVAVALRFLVPMSVRVVCQDRRMPRMQARSGVALEVKLGGVADRWAMYADADVVVLPRRYGGLCLPAQEAMAVGLGLVMSDCAPNLETWPALGIDAPVAGTLQTPCGEVAVHRPDPRHLARVLNELAAEPAAVAQLRARAAEWANRHSWGALAPLYRHRLAEAAGRV